MIKLQAKQIAIIKRQILNKQGGICPLCLRDMTSFQPQNVVLDHDHGSGLVRSALCRNCNSEEGRIKNRAIRCSSGSTYMEWLKRLSEYYQMHEDHPSKFLHHTHKTDYEKRMVRNKRARKAYANKK